MQSNAHDSFPQSSQETRSDDTKEVRFDQQIPQHDEPEEINLLDLATGKHGSERGVDIDKMMSQASSFMDHKKRKAAKQKQRIPST